MGKRGSYRITRTHPGVGGYAIGYHKAMIANTKDYFEEALAKGKIAEVKVYQLLKSQGFDVTDISNNIMEDGHFSPFDILAVYPTDRRFAIQVKSTSAAMLFYNAKESDIAKWEAYDTNAIKILIVVTANRGSLYIPISDIRSCRLVSANRTRKENHYVVYYKDMLPIEHLPDGITYIL